MTVGDIRPRLREIAATYATETPAEQAARLGLGRQYINRLRSQALKAGLCQAETRTHRKPWTAARLDEAESLLQDGLSVSAAARILGVSDHGLIDGLRDHRAGVRSVRRDGPWQVHSMRSVAELFGVSHGRVTAWVQSGLLETQKNRGRPSASWRVRRITDDQVYAFIGRRDAWMLWEPSAITDPLWREIAEDARRAAGGRWMRATEWARTMHFTVNVGNARCRRGQAGEALQRYRVWYVWIPETNPR